VENKDRKSPGNASHAGHETASGSQKQKTIIKPQFNALSNADAVKEHVHGLLKDSDRSKHTDILAQLISQFDAIDFEALAFPEVAELRQKIKEAEMGSEHRNEIRKRLAQLKVTRKHYLILSIENVLRVAERNRWGLCKNNDIIYLYNGMYWEDIDKNIFQHFLGIAAERMGVPKYEARHYQFREDLSRQFDTTAYLPAPGSKNDTVLINLKNGTFEITADGMRLRPFDRSDFITYQLPFAYDPEATAPIFDTYINRVLPDKERQKVLAEYLGFVFIKHGNKILKEEKALILYGSGANGKSVLFDVYNALLGPQNVSNYSLQSLTNNSGYYRAKLANKLVNYASEINGKLETDVFKQLVSGEPVEARLPYGQPLILKQYAKLIFNCNALPKDVENTNAYFRRFLIIPFDVTIPEHEQDKNLHNKIIEGELSGVFNWVLSGLQRLLAQKGFSACTAVDAAVQEFKDDSNSVKIFLDDNGFQRSPSQYVLVRPLFLEYRKYCLDFRLNAVKRKEFTRQLGLLGIEIGRKPGHGTSIAYLEKGDMAG
jgi:putative DNA primase/helicase